MKDKKKTKTIPRQVRWDKLDNTAHLFPSIAGESMTNVYRISVTLKEEVQVEFLQRALDMILPKFDGFNLRMRTGVFWYYLKRTEKGAESHGRGDVSMPVYPAEQKLQLSVPCDLL